MDLLTNATNLQEISFPVFKIGKHKPNVENGLCFFYTERQTIDNSGEDLDYSFYTIVDDKNIEQPTLAKRRLILAANEVKLAPLGNAVYFLGDLIKLATSHIWFIDSAGKVFNYKKTIRAKLRFFKIKNLIPITNGGVIIELHGLAQRFKALYRPSADKTYAGILYNQMSPILYGFYDKEYDSTWRLI